MKFKINPRENPNIQEYPREETEIAREFAKKVYDEFGSFVKSVILFGSASREATKTRDIDVLIIVDDVSVQLSREITQTYRIIIENLVADISDKLHVTTLRLTSFWEYLRSSDPVAVNILRDGVALIDSGFFDPLRVLLIQGRIRPTAESVWNYFVRAPTTLRNSQWHILQAALDLYWAVIDASHAILMHYGEIPPTPAHVSELVKEKIVSKKILPKTYPAIIKKYFDLAKKIEGREIKKISGPEYERYYKEATEFVDKIKQILEKERRKVK